MKMKMNGLHYVAITILIVMLVSAVICQMYYSNTLYTEGFVWSMKEKHDFENYRKASLPQTQFDLTMLQKQASPEEAAFLYKNGYWPWRDETKQLFLQELGQSTLIKSDPNISLDFYQKRYNDNAIRQLLGWNTKEGQFVLRGVTTKDGSKFQCKENNDGSSSMKKSWIDGYNLWNGYPNVHEEHVKNEDIPNQIFGFSFLKGPCNPCDNLEYNKHCPFKMKLKNNDSYVSPIWKMNWGEVGF